MSSHMDKLQKIIDTKKHKIRQLEKFLYDNPEIGLEEHAAKERFCIMLAEEGFDIDDNIIDLPTAFIAKKGSGDGPKIAFMAEYDALPESGHACGHNLIGAMSFGSAVALAEMLEDFPGTVYLFGTPAEETGYGKTLMIKNGYFSGIDVAIMAHPDNATTLSWSTTNLEGYNITFHGRASHAGACPEHGVNALDAVVATYNGISMLRQQLQESTRVHSIITKGGKAVNIIPDLAQLQVEIRHGDDAYFHQVVEKVLNIARGAALVTDTTVDIELMEPPICSLKTNSTLIELFRAQLLAAGIKQEDIIDQIVSGGCTDMGNVSHIVPSIHPMLKMVGDNVDVHSKEFLADVDSAFAIERMFLGVRCLAGVGLELLRNPELLSIVWADFRSK